MASNNPANPANPPADPAPPAFPPAPAAPGAALPGTHAGEAYGFILSIPEKTSARATTPDGDWVVEKIPVDHVSTSDYIHIRELDQKRMDVILTSLKDRATYDQTKYTVLAENPEGATPRYSIIDGAHHIAAAHNPPSKPYSPSKVVPGVHLNNKKLKLNATNIPTYPVDNELKTAECGLHLATGDRRKNFSLGYLHPWPEALYLGLPDDVDVPSLNIKFGMKDMA
ncbi:hypothetical protein HDU88_000521 [Geranomyces variabilis]|nr:hypothetical protein HDU88_000521 [Geranomyces variabilis]